MVGRRRAWSEWDVQRDDSEHHARPTDGEDPPGGSSDDSDVGGRGPDDSPAAPSMGLGGPGSGESAGGAGDAWPEDDGRPLFTIMRSIGCASCGYDLRGLPLSGRCPECGRPVLESVRIGVDPTASRLPRLRDPKKVGLGLVLLVGVMLLVALLMVLPAAAAWFEPPGARNQMSNRLRSLGMFWSWIALLVALWPVHLLAWPWTEERNPRVRRDLRLLGGGVVAGIVVAACSWLLLRPIAHMPGQWADRWEPIVLQLALLGAALVVLAALRKLLRVIGERSRQFRTARGGRQRLRDLIAALYGMMAGDGLRLAGLLGGPDWLGVVGAIVLMISTTMLLIGLIYMFVNVLWIARSILRPPMDFDELFVEERLAEAVEIEASKEDEGKDGSGEGTRPGSDVKGDLRSPGQDPG